MLPLNLRFVTSTIIGYAKDNAFPSIWVLRHVLCLAIVFLHQNLLPRSPYALKSLLLFYIFCAFLILHRSWLSCGRAKTFCCSWIASEKCFPLCLIESDPTIRGPWEFQARFYFWMLGNTRGRHSHCVLVREACLVQDEWKNAVVISSSIICTQCFLQLFCMPLLVLLQCKVT